MLHGFGGFKREKIANNPNNVPKKLYVPNILYISMQIQLSSSDRWCKAVYLRTKTETDRQTAIEQLKGYRSSHFGFENITTIIAMKIFDLELKWTSNLIWNICSIMIRSLTLCMARHALGRFITYSRIFFLQKII